MSQEFVKVAMQYLEVTGHRRLNQQYHRKISFVPASSEVTHSSWTKSIG